MPEVPLRHPLSLKRNRLIMFTTKYLKNVKDGSVLVWSPDLSIKRYADQEGHISGFLFEECDSKGNLVGNTMRVPSLLGMPCLDKDTIKEFIEAIEKKEKLPKLPDKAEVYGNLVDIVLYLKDFYEITRKGEVAARRAMNREMNKIEKEESERVNFIKAPSDSSSNESIASAINKMSQTLEVMMSFMINQNQSASKTEVVSVKEEDKEPPTIKRGRKPKKE